MKRSMFYLTAIFTLLVMALLFAAMSAGDSYAVWTAVIGMSVILICPVLSVLGIVEAPWPLVLVVNISIFLHCLGLSHFTLYYYEPETEWWDEMMHILVAVIIATVVVIGLLVTERYSKNIRVPVRWVPFFIVIMVMMVGTTWEVFEFIIDQSFGTNMQHSLLDTESDLLSDLIGGIIGGIGGAIYLSRHTFTELVDSLRIERSVNRVERFFNR